MRNIIIVCTVLLVAIAALARKYFTALSGKEDNVVKVLNYIPDDAAIVINFKNDESFYEIFKDYELFNSLIGKHHALESSQLKELLLKEALQDVTSEKNIFLSFHPGTDSVEFLYSVTLDKKFSAADLQEFITEISDFTVNALENNIYRLTGKTFNKPVYIFLQQGVALVSFSKVLINRSIDEKQIHSDKLFIEEINKMSGKNLNSPVNLFINHKVVPSFLQHFMQEKRDGNLALLNHIKGISSLSMNFKSDALMFNGIGITDTLKPHYFNIFLHQKAGPNQIKKILPENTADFIAFSLSDVNKFHKDLKLYFDKRGELKMLEDTIKSIRNNTGVDANRDIKPYLDKEFVTVTNSYDEKLAIIRTTNGRQLNFKLQLISTLYNDRISKIDHSGLFYYYFGDPLRKFSEPYFSVVDNYLVIANLPGIIDNFLNAYENERFLSDTEGFRQYDQLVANESNILYFVNNKNSNRIIRSVLKPGYAKALGSEGSDLKKFYGLSYQWTSDGDHFFSNLYLGYNSSDSLALNRNQD